MWYVRFEAGLHFSRVGRLETREARLAYYDLLAMAISENKDGYIEDTLKGFSSICRLDSNEMITALKELDGRLLLVEIGSHETHCNNSEGVTFRNVSDLKPETWISVKVFATSDATPISGKSVRALSSSERSRKHRAKIAGMAYYIDSDGLKRDIITDEYLPDGNEDETKGNVLQRRNAIKDSRVNKNIDNKSKPSETQTSKEVVPQNDSGGYYADEGFCKELLNAPIYRDELGEIWIEESTEQCRIYWTSQNKDFTRARLLSWLNTEVTKKRGGKKGPSEKTDVMNAGSGYSLTESEQAEALENLPDAPEEKRVNVCLGENFGGESNG